MDTTTYLPDLKAVEVGSEAQEDLRFAYECSKASSTSSPRRRTRTPVCWMARTISQGRLMRMPDL